MNSSCCQVNITRMTDLINLHIVVSTKMSIVVALIHLSGRALSISLLVSIIDVEI
jgi:hypothetical protein